MPVTTGLLLFHSIAVFIILKHFKSDYDSFSVIRSVLTSTKRKALKTLEVIEPVRPAAKPEDNHIPLEESLAAEEVIEIETFIESNTPALEEVKPSTKATAETVKTHPAEKNLKNLTLKELAALRRKTEQLAMKIALQFEGEQGRSPSDCSAKNLGYDVISRDSKGTVVRRIEVKGLQAAAGTVLVTPNEYSVMGESPDYYLYTVTNIGNGSPQLHITPNPASLSFSRRTVDYCITEAMLENIQHA